MYIFPAIDLMSGKVVRLEQGRVDRKTVYSDDPVGVARKWCEEGAGHMHVVDLDAAFSGILSNTEVVEEICREVPVSVQMGGGLRSMAALEQVLAAGVRRAVIGSKACESLDFVREAVREFGGDRLAVGIDAKDGKVAMRGWVEVSHWNAYDLAKAVCGLGIHAIIYTDISRDGMGTGPNLNAQMAMQKCLPPGTQLIASGGVGGAEDVRSLQQIRGLYGVIVGKALYDGKVTLSECLSITH